MSQNAVCTVQQDFCILWRTDWEGWTRFCTYLMISVLSITKSGEHPEYKLNVTTFLVIIQNISCSSPLDIITESWIDYTIILLIFKTIQNISSFSTVLFNKKLSFQQNARISVLSVKVLFYSANQLTSKGWSSSSAVEMSSLFATFNLMNGRKLFFFNALLSILLFCRSWKLYIHITDKNKMWFGTIVCTNAINL